MPEVTAQRAASQLPSRERTGPSGGSSRLQLRQQVARLPYEEQAAALSPSTAAPVQMLREVGEANVAGEAGSANRVAFRSAPGFRAVGPEAPVQRMSEGQAVQLDTGTSVAGEGNDLVTIKPEDTLSTDHYKTFESRFVAMASKLKMSGDADDAKRIWLLVISKLQTTNPKWKSAPKDAVQTWRNDLGSDAVKEILKDLNPIVTELEGYLAEEAKRPGVWAFWSGKPALAVAQANSDVCLEKSAIGCLFDNLNIDGAWNIELWARLSAAYATYAAKQVEGRSYRGFVGLGSSAEQSIFNKIEQPTFAKMLKAQGQAQPKVTWYACAGKVSDNMASPDHRFTGGGIQGTYGSGDRASMVDLAEKRNKERLDEHKSKTK